MLEKKSRTFKHQEHHILGLDLVVFHHGNDCKHLQKVENPSTPNMNRVPGSRRRFGSVSFSDIFMGTWRRSLLVFLLFTLISLVMTQQRPSFTSANFMQNQSHDLLSEGSTKSQRSCSYGFSLLHISSNKQCFCISRNTEKCKAAFAANVLQSAFK